VVQGTVLAVLAAVLVGALLAGTGRPPGRRGHHGHPVAARHASCPLTSVRRPHRPEDADALQVLHAWDRHRAAAYAAGSGQELQRLYTVGSAAGAADLRLLSGYRSRGWRVTGMRTQLLAVTVTRRRAGLWALRVTDRLERAVAVRDGRRVPLPRDAASTRLLTMTRAGDGRWRVVAVADG
jgi:hypothetical protein